MKKIICVVAVLIGALPLWGTGLFEPDSITVLPLKVKTIEKKYHGNIALQSFFFTSQQQDGEKFRIYAVCATPRTYGKCPLILHVHGGGQTASPKLAERWAKRGYACISFDWTGNPQGKYSGKRSFSRFGKQTKSKLIDYQFPEKIQESRVRYALVAARRALAWARQQANIDPNNIGVIGISWGGFYSLLLAGLEPEIKAVVDVYGCGFFSGSYCLAGPLVYRSAGARKKWLATYDPGAFLDRIKAPTLMISGTNDMFFPLRQFVRTYETLSGPKRLILEPGVNHSLNWRYIEKSAVVWFDHYPKGKKSQLPKIVGVEQRLDELKLRCKEEGARIKTAKLVFSWSDQSKKWNSKNKWISKTMERYKNSFLIKLPDSAPQGSQWLGYFASCVTDSGLRVSSPVLSLKVDKVKKTIANQNLPLVNAFADPSLEKQKGRGHNGKVFLNYTGTFALDDSGKYARSGKSAVRLGKKCQFVMQSSKVMPESEYIIAAWFKNAGDNGRVWLQVNWMKGKKLIKHYLTCKKVASGEYERVELKSTAPKNATHCYLYFRADDAWIDDLEFGATAP